MGKGSPKFNVGQYAWGDIVKTEVDYKDEKFTVNSHQYEIRKTGEKYSFWCEEEYVESLMK